MEQGIAQAAAQAAKFGSPEGVLVRPLDARADARGCFTEIFRQNWDVGVRQLQTNLVASAAGVLRGMHLHLHHNEYYVLAQGRALIGVHDLRRASGTFGTSTIVPLDGDEPALLTVPRGVIHGLYFECASILIAGVSEYYDPEDDLGCRWNDPALGIAWPTLTPRLSARDAAAPPLKSLQASLAALGWR